MGVKSFLRIKKDFVHFNEDVVNRHTDGQIFCKSSVVHLKRLEKQDLTEIEQTKVQNIKKYKTDKSQKL